MIRCARCGEENPPKFRLCGTCGAALAAVPLPAHEVRKTVTIVFSDLKGSTELGERLDAEALHEVKQRYFDAMAAQIARHGGKIEKYIGDAIMAVFGLPRAHEDDALRAVRAAVGMQGALRQVNAELQARHGVTLAQRIGVNTGEVVANDDPGADQKIATGDAVNVAARLEQAAPDDQVYLGDATYRLVRDAVQVEPVAPLELKGKAQRITAHRLVHAHGLDGNLRRSDTPLVGRDGELAAIERVLHVVIGGPCARMVTVIGDAGVGKSRLVHEVVVRAGAGAIVLRGRCLPYGDGITFWPLREMLDAAGIADDDKPEQAHARLLAYLGDRDVVDRVAAATGLSGRNFPLHEVYWAARRVLEILAERAPVVALIDDIHWAEPAFLDLLEHVLAAAGKAPILLLASARHELLEERAQWGEQSGASRIVLQPLADDAAAQVAANLLGGAGLAPDVMARIVHTAEGNPLYVEQLLSMLIDRGAVVEVDGRWVRSRDALDIDVPPTIHALLEARLDQLGRAERATVEPASVIGLEFPQSALAELAPAGVRGALDAHLETLTRKQFVRLSMAVDASARYRFHHQLVRDTVYNGLLKRARAQLHVDFVRWADKVNADRDRAREFEEIMGYHLEQAHRYLSELGPLDEAGQTIGVEAARRLGEAGRRAFARSDTHAAVNLLQRAAALLPEAHPARRVLLPELGEALMELGDFDAARTLLDQAGELASRAGDARVAHAARLGRMFVRLYGGEPGEWGAQALQVAGEVVAELEPLDAHNELAIAWRLTAFVHGVAGRYALAGAAMAKQIHFARAAGNERLVARGGLGMANVVLPGHTPVAEAIGHCDRILVDVAADRQVQSIVRCIQAQLFAMNGEFEKARAMVRKGRADLNDLGQGVMQAATAIDLARVELLAGDLAAAEREARADYDFLIRRGETYLLSSMAAALARLVRQQGRDDEALAFSRAAEAAAAEDDIDAQVQWRAVRAPIVARAGDVATAEDLARAALTMARAAEAPLLQADSLIDLGEVLEVAARGAQARDCFLEAAEIAAAKGDVVTAQRARTRAQQVRSGE